MPLEKEAKRQLIARHRVHGQRRRLLRYLSRTDLRRYQELIARLGLRR